LSGVLSPFEQALMAKEITPFGMLLMMFFHVMLVFFFDEEI
jgi:hypothetical protein